MSVNEKMKAIADAIREKTETTDLLTLDAMALAIEEIGQKQKICTGKLVFAEKQETPYIITHNLGVVPNFVYIQTIEPRISNATNNYQLRFASGWLEKTFLAIKDDPSITTGVQTESTYNSSGDMPYSNRDITTAGNGCWGLADENTITLNFQNYGRFAYPGQVFIYLFIAFEE